MVIVMFIPMWNAFSLLCFLSGMNPSYIKYFFYEYVPLYVVYAHTRMFYSFFQGTHEQQVFISSW